MYDAKIKSVCISCPLSIINIAHNREINTYTVGYKHPENNISFSFWRSIICSGFTPHRKQFWNKEPGFTTVSTWLSTMSCCSILATGNWQGHSPSVDKTHVFASTESIWEEKCISEDKNWSHEAQQLTLLSCPSVINADQRGPEAIDFTRNRRQQSKHQH